MIWWRKRRQFPASFGELRASLAAPGLCPSAPLVASEASTLLIVAYRRMHDAVCRTRAAWIILGAGADSPPVHRLRIPSGFRNAADCMGFRKATSQLQSTCRRPSQGSCPVFLTNLVLFPIDNRHR